MTSASSERPTARTRLGLRALLLGGSALAMLSSGAASAAGLPTQGAIDLSKVVGGAINTKVLNAGAVTAGTATFTTTSAGGLTADVTLTGARTLIDWTTFDVTSGNKVNFNFSNSASDVVLNRVKGGAITVETGGAVNGVFNGKSGGNIWFLADGGVFIHGTVTASGVLATNNTRLADLDLLSPNIGALKSQLSAAASLIDLSTTVVATGAEIDAKGNIVLSGDINTGATGVVSLTSTGSITQTGGVITASGLSGSSVGGAHLTGDNVFDTLGPFVNVGGGDVAITDAVKTALTVTGPVINFDGAGDVTLTTAGDLNLKADVRAPVGTVALQAGGAISQTLTSRIQAVNLTGSSKGGATLTSPLNAISNTLGAFSNNGRGAVTITDSLFLNVVGPVPNGAGNFVLKAPSDPMPIQVVGKVTSDLSQSTGKSGSGSISVQTAAGPDTVSYVSTGTTATITVGAVARTLIDWTSFTVAQGNTVNFQFTGAASDIVINRVTGAAITVDGTVNGLFGAGGKNGGSVWFLADGGVFLNGTVSASGVLAGNNTGLAAAVLLQTGIPSLKNALAAGGNSYFDLLSVGADVASATGAQINTGGSLQLLGLVDAGAAGSVKLVSAQALTQTSGSVIHAASLAGSATLPTSLIGANQFDTLAGFTQTGVGSVAIVDAKALGLTVSGAVSAGTDNNLTLTSAGFLAINAPITVGGASAVSLNYKAASPTDLSFGDAGSLTFTKADGKAATTSQGGSLTINAQAYTLLYALAQTGSTGPDSGTEDVAGIDVNTAAGGDAGFYALATSLTGTGTAASPQFTSSLAGAGANSFAGSFEGLGHTITGLTVADPTGVSVGLFGQSSGLIRDLGLVGGSVSGASASQVGGLLGSNLANGAVVLSYSSGAVAGGQTGAMIGGLVGANDGVITNAYASGGVSGADKARVGGLVGSNTGTGTVTLAYAMGAVTTGTKGEAGGLAGDSQGAISEAYATGAVSGSTGALIGGLVGANGGTVKDAAFDTLSTGQAVGLGTDTNKNKQSGNVAALSTSQLQGALSSGFGAAWGTGAGLYPYLNSFHPNGVEAVSGFAFADVGITTLASGAKGAVSVTLTVDGAPEGSATTGANGYYYFALPTGAVGGASASTVLTTIAADATTGALNAGGLISSTGTTSGLNLYGGYLLYATPATTFSTTGFAAAKTLATGFASTPAFVAGLNDFILATGASFTVDTTVTQANGLGIQTTGANAPITIAKAITLSGGAPLTLVSAGDLAINANLKTVAGIVTLSAGGVISESSTSTVTAGVLTGGSSGGATLSGANLFDTLGDFANGGKGDVNIVDTQSTGLTVAGAVSTGAGATILINNQSGKGGGALIVNGSVSAPGGTVTLLSDSTIGEGVNGIVTAGNLKASSIGGITLKGANQVDTLAAFTNAGSGTLAFTNAKASALTVGADIAAGAGDIILTTTGKGGDITLSASLTTDSARAVTLAATGVVSQTAEANVILTGTLRGTSVGGAALTNANVFNTLDGFANSGGGDLGITDTQSTGLTVTGAVTVGVSHVLTLTNAGALTLKADLGLAGAIVDLESADAINQLSGAISAGTLRGASANGVLLTGANLIDNLGPFKNTGTGGINLVDAQATGLTVSGGVDAGAGNSLSLSTTATKAGASLVLAGDLTATGGTVNLSSAGTISQNSANVITAKTLNSASNGSASLTGSNQVQTLNSFTNAGAGDLSFTDAIASGLTLGVDIDAKAGNIALVSKAAKATLVINANLTTDAKHQLSLTSAGAISQGTGVITTGALAGGSTGGTTLGQNNLIATLGTFTNKVSGGFTLVDTAPAGLTVTGIVDAGPGGTVDLTSASTLSESAAGSIVAATLNARATGANTLTGANRVASLGVFTNGGSGDLAFTDKATDLTVTTSLDSGAGDIVLTTNQSGILTISADLTTDAHHQVALLSAGILKQAAGVITTGTLTGSSVGGASFDNSANAIGTFGGFVDTGNGDVTVANGQDLTVQGAVKLGTGTLTLVSAGLIAADTATITAGTLTGSSVGGASFDNSANAIGTFGGFVDTSNGDVTVANGQDLTVQGAVKLGTGALTLVSAGVIAADTATITAGSLTGSSVGGASFNNSANAIVSLAGFKNRNTGAIEITNSISLAINAAVDNTGGTPGGAGRDISVNLTDGSITGSGAFTAGRDVAIRTANGSLTFATATAGDDVVLRATTGVTVSGALVASGTASAADLADTAGGGDALAASLPTGMFGHAYSDMTNGAHVDAQSTGGNISVGKAITAAGDVRLQARAGSISYATLSAGGDVALDARLAISGGAGVAGGDVAINSGDAVSTGDLTAGGDIALRAAGLLTVTGSLVSGAGLDPIGAANNLAAFAPLRVFGGADKPLLGAVVDIGVGAVTVTGDVLAAVAGSDIRIVASGGALSIQGAVTAGQDVALDVNGGDVHIGGALQAARDAAIWARSGSVDLASAGAGDDLLIRAGGDVTVATTLTSGLAGEAYGAADELLAQNADAAMTAFDHSFAGVADGSHIDVVADGGGLSLGDAALASGGDLRLRASGAVGYTTLTATRDVLVDAGLDVTGGGVRAGAAGDIAISGAAVSVASLSAGDDVVLRATGGVTVTGTIAAGSGSDVLGAGDYLSTASPLTILEGVEPALTGGVVDIGAGDQVTVTGAITAGLAPGGAVAQPLSDIRVVTTGLNRPAGPVLQLLGAVTASGDIGLDALNGGLSVGGVASAGRDMAARAGAGAISLVSVTAADDIVLGADGAITVTGALTAGTGGEAVGLGDQLAEAGPMVVFGPPGEHSYTTDRDGAQIDVVGGGNVTIAGLASSSSDVRLKSSLGAVLTADIAAGRDIVLEAATTVTGGALNAKQDVAVNAGNGDLVLDSALAGDDVVMRSGGATVVNGTVTAGAVEGSGAGDFLVLAKPMTAVSHTYTGVADGATIDIVAQGAVSLVGAATAHNGDVRLQSLGATVQTTDVVAGRDIVIDAATSVTVGPSPSNILSAGADIAILARSGGIALTSAAAGNDLVLRSVNGAITVSGSLDSGTSGLNGYTGAGISLAAWSPLDLFRKPETSLGGGSTDIGAQRLTVGGHIVASGPAADVRIVTTAGDLPGGPALRLLGAVTAGGDVAVDSQGGSILAGGPLIAGGDAAIWAEAGSVSLAQVQAGDDALIRAATTVVVTGDLRAGGRGESGGAADRLLTANPNQAIALFGQTQSSLADGSHVDVVARTVSVGGSITAAGTGSDVRLAATGADPSGLSALSVIGPVNAGRDVALDAATGSITLAAAAIAGRDIAARSLTGNINIASATAGDDVVLSAPLGGVRLNGSVTAGAPAGSAGPGLGKTLFDTISAPLDGLFTLGNQSIFIDAVTYANAGYASSPSASLTAGTAIGLALADPTGLFLADDNPNKGSWVKAATLVAPTVTLFESKGPINVGGSKLDSHVATLNLYTADIVRVTGVLAPAADNTVDLTIGTPYPDAASPTANVAASKDWTPSVIAVINDAATTDLRGAIGVTSVSATGVYSTTPTTFKSATLYATTNILLGTQAFIDANAKVTDIAGLKQINPVLPLPVSPANSSKAVMLAAGDLALSSGRMIVQQNTTGLRTTEGTGYYVTRTLTLGSYGASPPAIDLFGVFTKPGTTIAITGPSAAVVNQIFLTGSLASSEFRPFYRVNGCVIGELGNCTPTSDGITEIPLDKLSEGSLLSRDEQDVEDPTITGAPNEEIWRRPDDRP